MTMYIGALLLLAAALPVLAFPFVAGAFLWLAVTGRAQLKRAFWEEGAAPSEGAPAALSGSGRWAIANCALACAASVVAIATVVNRAAVLKSDALAVICLSTGFLLLAGAIVAHVRALGLARIAGGRPRDDGTAAWLVLWATASPIATYVVWFGCVFFALNGFLAGH